MSLERRERERKEEEKIEKKGEKRERPGSRERKKGKERRKKGRRKKTSRSSFIVNLSIETCSSGRLERAEAESSRERGQ